MNLSAITKLAVERADDLEPESAFRILLAAFAPSLSEEDKSNFVSALAQVADAYAQAVVSSAAYD
ncbi:hypothetical protein LG047_15310 [Methylocystis sp. WRRC1]|uniref:hypothetical protein n=1 Tax=Methylocystis sp. WRRC1 TaxID=1732014 RepID=UPI001D1434AC|nr:hypothetical protein [Methylocystis sp. WRRC1]MCC3246668.1 hypothetical protein [Methylocystis sp. WRRC1]